LDATRAVAGKFESVDLSSAMVAAKKVLTTLLDPAHGPTQATGGGADHNIFRREGTLEAEGTSDVGDMDCDVLDPE
jgi:hypothetical protein